MCGRYSITSPIEAVRELFGCEGDLPGPRFNMAPQQMAPVIRLIDGKPRLDLLRWGLIPAWAKDAGIANKLINARCEGVAEKPSFRGAFAKRRCLVLADGFYEWQPTGGRKQPWRITLPNGQPFAMAGLWESWRDPAGQTIETFCIVTTEATAEIAHIHGRMPVILTPDGTAPWLDPATPKDVLLSLLVPYPGRLRAYPVSARVGNVRNDDAGLVDPLAEPAPQLL